MPIQQVSSVSAARKKMEAMALHVKVFAGVLWAARADMTRGVVEYPHNADTAYKAVSMHLNFIIIFVIFKVIIDPYPINCVRVVGAYLVWQNVIMRLIACNHFLVLSSFKTSKYMENVNKCKVYDSWLRAV